MSDIKSDVKETVKAFIQTLVSILVREATKTIIKNLTERQKKRFEDRIKDMSDDQLGQYLDENPYFKDSLENALKLLGSTQSAKETVSLMEKLQSVYEGTPIKKPISSFIWPAPKIIFVTVVGVALLATIAVQAFSENPDNNTSLLDNNSTFLFDNNTTSTQSPVANFTTNVTNGSSPLTVQFSDLSENAKERSWDFGDGNNSKELNPVHTYFAKGNYTVNLTAINGTKTNSAIATITVLEMPVQPILEGSMSGPSKPAEPLDSGESTLPVANFSTNIISGYAPLTVQFNDSSQNATSWSWDFGDGQISSAQDPINTYYSAGTYTVSLIASNANGSNISTKSNLISVDKTTQTLNWNNPADITYGTALSTTQLNAFSSVPGTFAYTPSAGTVLSAGSHILHVAFTPNDTANYPNASKDITINVKPVAPTINWSNPDDRIYWESIEEWNVYDGEVIRGVLNAEFLGIDGNPLPGNHTYTPATGTVLSVGTHTLHVDFTPADTANYTNASKDVTINILQATPVIYWTYPGAITYGEPIMEPEVDEEGDVLPGVLDAEFVGMDGTPLPGNYSYTPEAGTVLSADTHTLHVDFTPTDTANYTNASKNVTINVMQATPEITWNFPNEIYDNTPLLSQVYAQANVAGTFVYLADGIPVEVDTNLSEGDHTLTVTFTPTDTNYTTKTETIDINVKMYIG